MEAESELELELELACEAWVIRAVVHAHLPVCKSSVRNEHLISSHLPSLPFIPMPSSLKSSEDVHPLAPQTLLSVCKPLDYLPALS